MGQVFATFTRTSRNRYREANARELGDYADSNREMQIHILPCCHYTIAAMRAGTGPLSRV